MQEKIDCFQKSPSLLGNIKCALSDLLCLFPYVSANSKLGKDVSSQQVPSPKVEQILIHMGDTDNGKVNSIYQIINFVVSSAQYLD